MAGKSMKRFDLVIPLRSGREHRVVEAYETGTPGLFVHRDIKDRYQWAVTHWSGILITGFEWKTRDEAIEFAGEIVDVLDWYRPIERIHEQWITDPTVREAVEIARIRVAEQRTGTSGTNSDRDTRDAETTAQSATGGARG